MTKEEIENEKLLNSLTDSQKDYIYRKVWAEHVKEDVLSVLAGRKDNLSDKEKQEIAEEAAYLYCEEGQYDCNLSYWENVENLVNELV